MVLFVDVGGQHWDRHFEGRAQFASGFHKRTSNDGRDAQPLGIKLLAAFFVFGAGMSALTIVLLLFPGTRLDSLWRLDPEA